MGKVTIYSSVFYMLGAVLIPIIVESKFQLKTKANCPENSEKGLSCHKDCQTSHNAMTGVCDDYNFCNCSTFGAQCSHSRDHCISSGHVLADFYYQEACDLDCLCNHGMAGGQCKFGLGSHSEYVGSGCDCTGGTPHDNGCPCEDYDDYLAVQEYLLASAGVCSQGLFPRHKPPGLCGYH